MLAIYGCISDKDVTQFALQSGSVMPSLIRFLVFCAVIAGIIYGGMFALATFVEPNPREMTVRIPPSKLDR